MRGEASAPASSANLGPGFDSIALALDLRCVVRVERADEWVIRSGGADPGPDATGFVMAAALKAQPAGALRIEIESEVPRASGLGSSAAVAVAVVAATLRCSGRDATRDEVFALASDCEGHRDNAAAATYGGLAVVTEDGVLHLEVAESLVPVVAVPDTALLTVDARAALPTHVPIAAAARNVARAVSLIEGLRTGDDAALAAAAGDELHETYRAGLSPRAGKLMAAARAAGALHAAWSGAGPSVLAFATEKTSSAVAEAFAATLDGEGRVLSPDIDRAGLR